MLRLTILTVGMSLVGTRVLAQERLATLDDVRRALSPGDAISVVRTNGQPISGTVMHLTNGDVEIRTETRKGKYDPVVREVVTIPLAGIRSLERPPDPVGNGILTGLAVGAGVGAGLFAYGAAVDANEMDEWASGGAVLAAGIAGLGALVGWLVDSSNSKPHIRFDAASTSSARLVVRPMIGRRLGLGIRLSF
jgi:hypothetical protein